MRLIITLILFVSLAHSANAQFQVHHAHSQQEAEQFWAAEDSSALSQKKWTAVDQDGQMVIISWSERSGPSGSPYREGKSNFWYSTKIFFRDENNKWTEVLLTGKSFNDLQNEGFEAKGKSYKLKP